LAIAPRHHSGARGVVELAPSVDQDEKHLPSKRDVQAAHRPLTKVALMVFRPSNAQHKPRGGLARDRPAGPCATAPLTPESRARDRAHPSASCCS
jgi:hypothetical protein